MVTPLDMGVAITQNITTRNKKKTNMTFYLLRGLSAVSEEIWKICENNANTNDLVFFLGESWGKSDAQTTYTNNQGSAVGLMGDLSPYLPVLVPFFFQAYWDNIQLRQEILSWTSGKMTGNGVAMSGCGEISDPAAPASDGSDGSGTGGKLVLDLDEYNREYDNMIKFYLEHPENLG